jgi:DNA-binding CsgD family transcriptional regulator
MSPDELAALAALDESFVNAAIVALLQWLHIGIAVIDARLRLHHANPSAHAILAQGTHLRVDGERVVGAHRNATRDFVALLDAALHAGGTLPCMAQVSATGRGALELVVRATEEASFGRCFVVLLNEVRARRAGSANALQSLHGLTAAEAQVALRLARGLTVAEAAADLGVGITTARTHLHHALRKTGTRRQAELVGLIASSLAYSMHDALPTGAHPVSARGLDRMIESTGLTAALSMRGPRAERDRGDASARGGAHAAGGPLRPSID